MSVAAKLNGPGPKGRLFLHQHEVIKCLVSLPQVVPKFYSFVCNPSFPLFANLWLVNLINPKTPSLVLTVANLRIFSTLSLSVCVCVCVFYSCSQFTITATPFFFLYLICFGLLDAVFAFDMTSYVART